MPKDRLNWPQPFQARWNLPKSGMYFFKTSHESFVTGWMPQHDAAELSVHHGNAVGAEQAS